MKTNSIITSLKLKSTDTLIMVIFILLGFLVVTQLKVQSTPQKLASLSEQDLGQIIRELTLETDALRKEIFNLQVRLYDYERKEATQRSVLNQAVQDLQTMKILAGIAKVKGPGIKVSIIDEENTLRGYDFLELIDELKSAGAEAIAVNNHRLKLWSFFKDAEGKVYLNGEVIESPYQIIVLGDPEVLYQSLSIPGGVIDTFSPLPGVNLIISRESEIALPATKIRKLKYGKPIKE